MARHKTQGKEILSGSEFIVLAFIDKGISYGLDIVDKSSGLVKRGTVYTTLQRFCKLGFLSDSKKISKQIIVKNVNKTQFVATYELTEKGKQVLDDNRRSWERIWQTLQLIESVLVNPTLRFPKKHQK
jgi:DNA-binding PadR family transcriptional regulator